MIKNWEMIKLFQHFSQIFRSVGDNILKFFPKTKAYKEFQEMIMEYKKAKEFKEVIMGYKKAFVPNLEVLQTASSVKRLSIANLVR